MKIDNEGNDTRLRAVDEDELNESSKKAIREIDFLGGVELLKEVTEIMENSDNFNDNYLCQGYCTDELLKCLRMNENDIDKLILRLVTMKSHYKELIEDVETIEANLQNEWEKDD